MRHLRLSVLLLALVFLGAGCLGGNQITIQPVTLQYWRTDDDESDFKEIIESYQKIHPNVTIEYSKIRKEDYERVLLEALAEDRGPDLFSIPNVWLTEWQGKLLPMPEETVIPTRVVNEKQQIVTINQTAKTKTKIDLDRAFLEVVVSDIYVTIPAKERGKPATNAIVGLPYSTDTLALFYNEDLLKNAAIEEPPSTWRDLQEQSRKLTLLDDNKDIRQSGAAMGLADNVDHHMELLSGIMIQNGAVMVDGSGSAAFHKDTATSGDAVYPPGIEALIFYQNFGIKGSRDFSWDNRQSRSLDAFATGKTAFYFGFPSDRDAIKERSPKLNFSVAPLPQVDPSKVRNIAKYPVEVVSAKTAHPNETWDFLLYATDADRVSSFLAATKKPTALRALISAQLDDPEIAPFASQLLTAVSWYKGADYGTAEEAFGSMINTKPTEKVNYSNIIQIGIQGVNQSWR